MEQTECSETSAYKIQAPGNCPEKKAYNIQNTAKVWNQEYLKHVDTVFRNENPFSVRRGVAPWQADRDETNRRSFTNLWYWHWCLLLKNVPHWWQHCVNAVWRSGAVALLFCDWGVQYTAVWNFLGKAKYLRNYLEHMNQHAMRLLLPLVRLAVARDNYIKIRRLMANNPHI